VGYTISILRGAGKAEKTIEKATIDDVRSCLAKKDGVIWVDAAEPSFAELTELASSVVGVLVFAGLTAWDTQRLKSEYVYGAMEGATLEKSAIMGALSLYLNFINLFTMLLQLFGQRQE